MRSNWKLCCKQRIKNYWITVHVNNGEKTSKLIVQRVSQKYVSSMSLKYIVHIFFLYPFCVEVSSVFVLVRIITSIFYFLFITSSLEMFISYNGLKS